MARLSLPIEPVLADLLTGLREKGRVVLKAPPGAGKTTRVPEVILESGLAASGMIMLLEPRRVAARAAARFLAQRRQEAVGETVGLSIRYENQRSKKTRLLVVTEGVLTRQLVRDPLLDGVSCVILDELHERSLHTDLALGFLRETLQVRDDLLVVAMSATLETAAVADFLTPAVVVESEGRAHPIDITYLVARDDRRLEDRVASAVRAALQSDDASEQGGDILVFLPGSPEIRRTEERLVGIPATVMPLYGSLSPREQERALAPSGRTRRVILSTNVAETSVTIDGVTRVIDAGYEKRVRFDATRGVELLETVRISRFSATQRAGRAGRTGPGQALRLWSQAEDSQLHDAAVPEITRTDPAPVLLSILGFGADPHTFPLLSPLPKSLVESGLAQLEMLGLVKREALTPRGRQALAMPLSPRLATFLLFAAERGVLMRAALAAALLEERDVLFAPRETLHHSDLEHRLDLMEDLQAQGLRPPAAKRLGLDFSCARRVHKASEQLLNVARRAGLSEAVKDDDLTPALLAAFPDRLAVRRKKGSDRARMMLGGGVRLHETCGVRDHDFFIALDLGTRGGGRGDLTVRLAHGVNRETLDAELGHLMVTEDVATLGDDGRVRGQRRTRLGTIVIETKEGVAVGQEAIERGLREAAEAAPERWQKLDQETQNFFDRVRVAARVLGGDWPRTDAQAINDWLPELVVGLRTLDDLRKADLRSALQHRLTHEQNKALREQLPARLTVPSGSEVTLDYSAAASGEGPPVLAVRMQEMFGATETPRVAGEPVLLHLLAPNRRPAQVTIDLGGFWERTWPEVRKELMRRYPKHSWPDDPTVAEPEKRPRRKRPPKK